MSALQTKAMAKPMTKSISNTDSLPSFIAFAADEVTRSLLVRITSERGWAEAQVFPGGLAEAVETLAAIPAAELIVVDLSGLDDPLADLSALAEVCDAGTRVIAMGVVNDVELYRGLTGLGVEDYLVKPVSPGKMNEALDKVLSRENRERDEAEDEAPRDTPRARMIAVTNACGGAGASMVAANAAWIMAHELGLKTALVDLDLYFGTAALTLDLEPGRGFREALENPERIDTLFVERAMVKESGNLFVLAAEEPLDTSFAFDPRALELLLDHLSRDFECVILDMPRFAARTQLDCNAGLTHVVVVADPSLTGMRDSARLIKMVGIKAPKACVQLVLNRAGAMKNCELTKEDFEHGGEVTVDFTAPFDAKSITESNGTGRTVADVAARSRLAAVLRELARNLSGAEEEKNTHPLMRHFESLGASIKTVFAKRSAA